MTDATNNSSTIGARIAAYLRRDVRSDAVAGLTVAVMGVPQAMAYALIAELPPVYGLYTAIVTCLVSAALGSSNHLVTGPTNALCMVMLSLTAHLPEKYGMEGDAGFLSIILLLTFMTGVIQLAFGMMRLGRIIRYVSNSVVLGFTAGAGILIAANQLRNVFGIDISGANAERLYEVVIATFEKLPETNPFALAVGVGTAVIVVVTMKIDRRLPAALIGVVVSGVAVWLLGWTGDGAGGGSVQTVRDIQPISGSLPPFRLPELVIDPNYDLTRELGTGALALAILGLIEASSISRAIASRSGQRLNFNREFMAQGFAKMVGAFFSCFAGSGSFTRTALCYQSGGRTRMAAAFSAAWTALALVFLGGVANQIPTAALAGLLIVIAVTMVDRHRLRATWRSGRNTRVVLAGTFVSTLVLPLEYAIFVGVFLSVVILLRTTARTDLTQLVPTTDSRFEEVPFSRAPSSPVVTVNMSGALYFAAAEDLDYELLKCVTPQTRVIVLRMKRLRSVGSTAMAMLEHFWVLLRQRRITLVVCGIENELKKVMTGSGLRKQIGEQNIFYADNRLFQSTELALARAWSIVDVEGRGADVKRRAPEPAARRRVVASDIMTTHCIRFGNEHQLREAVWLMSELQKHTKAISPQPLFLQDREAKLAAELGPWRLLSALTAAVDTESAGSQDSQVVGERMRRDFTKRIDTIARTHLKNLSPDTSLARLLESSVHLDLQVVPICDTDGRLKGLVSTDDMLRGLHDAISRVHADSSSGGPDD